MAYSITFLQDGTGEKMTIDGSFGKYFIYLGIQNDGHYTSCAGPFKYYLDARVHLNKIRPNSYLLGRKI